MGLQPTIFGRRPSNPFDNKVPGGHSDIIGGAVVGSREHIENIFHRKVHFGGNADPNSCFLLEPECAHCMLECLKSVPTQLN